MVSRLACHFIVYIVAANMPAHADALPPIKSLRYQENYSGLADTSDNLSGISRLKFVPLTDQRDVFASIGGEFRERYEYTNEPLFGVTARPSEDVFLHRLLLHGDLRWKKRFRAFVRLGSYFQSGRDGGPYRLMKTT